MKAGNKFRLFSCMYAISKIIQYLCFVILRNTMSEKFEFTEEQVQLARWAKAMGHPVRVFILELLSRQSCCYSGDLAEELPIARSTLSQHLKELKEAGLIQGEITAPKIKYCLNKKNWPEARKLFVNFFNPSIEKVYCDVSE